MPFRGLKQSRSIYDLQVRRRKARNRCSPNSKSGTELRKEFKKRNKAARDDFYSLFKSAEQKPKAKASELVEPSFQ